MKKLISSCLLACFALQGCAAPSPAKQYIVADKMTYEAIAPEYRKYVESDDDLKQEQKLDRFALLESWRKRIEMAESFWTKKKEGK